MYTVRDGVGRSRHRTYTVPGCRPHLGGARRPRAGPAGRGSFLLKIPIKHYYFIPLFFPVSRPGPARSFPVPRSPRRTTARTLLYRACQGYYIGFYHISDRHHPYRNMGKELAVPVQVNPAAFTDEFKLPLSPDERAQRHTSYTTCRLGMHEPHAWLS